MYKIWGTSFGIIGDLVMSLPQLTYFEKKYPGSYKYFGIVERCSQSAPLFFNHPLIDRIKITAWDGFDEEDYKIAASCDFSTMRLDHKNKIVLKQNHKVSDWYNYWGCVENTAKANQIEDLTEVLTEDEQIPKLYKWFTPSLPDNYAQHGYSRKRESFVTIADKSLAIWPFAGYGSNNGRSPSKDWWISTIASLISDGYTIYHFGWVGEPVLSESDNYHNLTSYEFFTQIKAALACDISIGTDSGSMWIMSAYEHPTIVLASYWQANHNKNATAFIPPNKKGTYIFNPININRITYSEVKEKVNEISTSM